MSVKNANAFHSAVGNVYYLRYIRAWPEVCGLDLSRSWEKAYANISLKFVIAIKPV